MKMLGWKAQGLTYELPGTRGLTPPSPMASVTVEMPVMIQPKDGRRKPVPGTRIVLREPMDGAAWVVLAEVFHDAGAEVETRPRQKGE